MGASRGKGCVGWLIVLVVAALVVTAAVIAFKVKHKKSSDLGPVPGPPGAVTEKYADALGVALQFFQVQKCSFTLFPEFCFLLKEEIFIIFLIRKGEIFACEMANLMFLTLFLL